MCVYNVCVSIHTHTQIYNTKVLSLSATFVCQRIKRIALKEDFNLLIFLAAFPPPKPIDLQLDELHNG